MKTMKNYINKILNFITTIIIILLSISVISSFQTTFFGKKYNSFFGYSLFEIQTASMAGEMEIGDWILVKITDDVKLNDIITFEQDGSFITHRIIEQYKDTYITKGDSNNSKDTPITKEQIVGKMIKVMPKFGIVKKTFFNPKVLITLIITIIVGTWLFDKNSNETKKIKDKVTLKSKTKKTDDIDFDFFSDNNENSDEVIEKIDKQLEKKKNEVIAEETNEDELNNTMVLSKIVVDMNSKALTSISKHLEDTVTLEPVADAPTQKQEVKTEQKTFTGKKILLGKNEKNLIRKGLELKENEIVELVKKILNEENLEGELRAITNKFVDIYIESKYLNQGEITEDLSLTAFKKNVEESIVQYSNLLIKEKKNENYKNKIINVMNAFKLINKIDCNTDNIENIIETTKYFDFENKKNLVKEINKVTRQFNQNLSSFFQKLETKKFKLIIKNIFKSKIFRTNISSNIQFNKLFSQYSIDKTYHNEVIFEDLRELQLKMLSLTILQDMFEFSYKKKYLISLSESIFKKEKKLKSFLGNIDDTYSQGKINILIDAKTLLLNYNVISNLNKEGYQFSIEITYSDLVDNKNIRKYLCIANNLIIINKDISKELLLESIPSELENKIILMDKSIIEGPVIK